MNLSIVIPVFNKFNFTKSCLNDLEKLDKNHQIIIVDNGSIDETKNELEKYSKIINFTYIRNDKNLGFAKACNIGYNNSEASNVMFLNNDIRIKSNHERWTDGITEAISTNKNCLVGPTAGLVDPSMDFKFCYETGDSNKKINYMSGWCISASKNTWDKLIINTYRGPFSEEFGIAYFEDTDLGFRAKNLGIEFKLVDIPVTHFGKMTSAQLNTYELYNNARKIFLNKWSKK